jgi:hypothetical protein
VIGQLEDLVQMVSPSEELPESIIREQQRAAKAEDRSREELAADEAEPGKAKSNGGKRGRPKRSDAEIEADQRILQMWESGSYENYDQLAQAELKSRKDIERTLSRERQRLRRKNPA